MKKDTENKIDKTLQSIEGITRAEANPYLFEKIKLGLSDNSKPVSVGIKWSWVSACCLVLLLNCGSVYYYFQKNVEDKKETAYQNIGNELGLNQSYNY